MGSHIFFYWRGRDSSCVGIYWWNVEGNGWIRYHNLPYQISIGVYALHYTAQMHEYATVLKPGHEEFAGVFSRMSTLAILVILHEGFSWWIHALIKWRLRLLCSLQVHDHLWIVVWKRCWSCTLDCTDLHCLWICFVEKTMQCFSCEDISLPMIVESMEFRFHVSNLPDHLHRGLIDAVR